MPLTIGERIKKYRQEAKLSLSDVAEKAGITKGYLWQLEEGQTKNPSLDTLVGIAKALDKTVAELMYGEALVRPAEGPALQIPPSLREFRMEQEKSGEKITEKDLQMLASIHYRGKRPKTVQDWQTLYNVIKTVSKKT